MASVKLGKVAGLKIIALPSAIIGFFVLWVILTVIGAGPLGMGLPTALIGGLIGAVLHYFAETLHQLGHQWAARRTGYPMSGIAFWLILAKSLYPPDEPELPAAIHIRRALGGPIGSLTATLVGGLIFLAVQSGGGLVAWLALFFFLDNLFVFTLGAFLPLGFTDGSTLLYWWGKR
ncbi:MAG: hypothetical protein K8I60_00265 [Anaerolineae bacterium]|nr:hypothetical protein [Anaerolineae bacterium]